MDRLAEILRCKQPEIGRAKSRLSDFRRAAEERCDFRDFVSAIRRSGARASSPSFAASCRETSSGAATKISPGRMPDEADRDARAPEEHRVRIIAEAKKASPSAGVIAANYDPVAMAHRYRDAGADAISVLTEPNFFGGAPEHLTAVRNAIPLPVLRKDFIVDEAQVFESIAMGADAILLIVAALQSAQLRLLHDCAVANHLHVLVEVHTKEELAVAGDAGARIIGINNRDLSTFEVDLTTTERLLPAMPPGISIVSESGIRSEAEVERLSQYPIDALLIGEALMRANGAALTSLLRGRK